MVKINEERLVSLFKELCLIDAPPLAEQDSVAFVKKLLIDEGFEVTEDDAGQRIGGKANNIIAWMRGSLPSAPKIFFSAHFDTVEPTKGLRIVEEHGYFRSASDTILGADDKAGMAPAIEACLAIREAGIPHGDICLLLSVAEEIGLLGAAALKIDELGLDYGYVLDTGPPVGTYVNRTATHDKLTVTITGKPAHAGKEPEKGINAIQIAAEAIKNMRLGRIDAETTANLGSIHGGSATNVVCASVTIEAEARSTDVDVLDNQVGHMVQQFEEATTKYGAQVEIQHLRHYHSYLVPADSPVIQIGQAAARKLGLSGALRTNLGGSDANAYNHNGLQCVVLATGMDRIHTHEERILRSDLVLTTRLVVEIVIEAAALENAKQ